MIDTILNSVHQAFPALPGGPATFIFFLAVVMVLLLLYRRTRWGGWLAFLVAILAYATPFLFSYRA